MPDPRKLKIGDRVRFISLPDEWRAPGSRVHKDSLAFMNAMISRKRPCRIYKKGTDGHPWIEVRLRYGGKTMHHQWCIYEKTGWRLVKKRIPSSDN